MTLPEDTCDGLGREMEAMVPVLDLPPDIPALRMFYLYLSAGCNLNCRHCWITPTFVNGKPIPAECLDIELIKKAVVEAKPLGLAAVKLTGGEPTLHPEFIRVVDFLSDQGLSLTMETNGTLIDQDIARHLADGKNLSHVAVSLDSPDPAWHDQFRGKRGAFDAAVRGMENLVAAGFRPQIIMSVTRDNAGQIERLIELAIRLGANSVKFNPVTPSGRGADIHHQGQGLNISELLELTHRIRGPVQDRHKIYLSVMLPPAMWSVKELLRYRGMGGACHVRNILGLLGTGEMALCGIGRNIPELCFGMLGKDSVRKVWINHPTLIKMRQDLEDTLPGLCGNCIHAGRCLAHCVAMNYEATGKLVDVSPICAAAEKAGLFPEGRKRDGRWYKEGR